MPQILDRDALVAALTALPPGRRLVAVVGAPGSGKSKLAEQLVERLNAETPGRAAVVPMDGFHYDNALLEPQGLLPRKGAPETFDVQGLAHLLTRLRQSGDGPVAIPVFDRDLELSRAAGRMIDDATEILIVEGNYLLLDEAPWDRLYRHFERTILLDVDEDELKRRLLNRWAKYGYDAAEALRKAEENDLPNGRRMRAASRPADWVVLPVETL